MEFRILGPVQVWDDRRRVPLGGPQPEKALALLLVRGERPVSVEEMIDALWDGEPPATARHQVHKLIAALRRRLPRMIATDGRAYRLCLAGSTVDATIFAALVATRTIPQLTRALALWRGPALAGLSSRALRAPAATLDEQRLAATEALFDLRLAAGQAAAVAAELPAVIASHPLRETLRVQLMTALHGCGRTAEALSAYAHTRTVLAEELGADPGPELVRLHRRLLSPGPGPDGDTPPAPCTLPYDLPDFSGRADELDRLLDGTGPAVVHAVDGMAGIGKTALVVHAAHRLAARYPDGQLYCDLHAHTPGATAVGPEVVLERLLRMIGVAPETVPDGLEQRSARWRAELATRRILLVLDNAASAAQVRPLLPGTSRCLTLVTSRRRLGMIDGATVHSLEAPAPRDALALLGAVVGAARVADEPDAAAALVRLCGYLPLAIRIAGTRLAHRPRWSIAWLVDRLRAHNDRLAELAVADRSVASAFALSHAGLRPAEQRMFGLLGLHPGAEFDGWSAAALADTTPRRAEALLEALVDAHLLRHAPAGRYTLHDLLREYARGLAPTDDRPATRLHDYYLAAATAATDLISEARRFEPAMAYPPRHVPPMADLDTALTWLAGEHPTLLAVCAATGDWQLPCALRAYFEHRGYFVDWRTTHERALRGADPRGTALIRFSLGALAMWTDRLEEGMAHFAHVLRAGTRDRQLTATALTNLGMLAHLLHRDADAADYLRRALAIEHDNPRTTALGWNNLGLTEGRLGHADAAVAHHRLALRMARRAGSAAAERGILLGLGETSLRLGRPARQPFARALTMARAGRFRMQEALALDGLAHATGEPGYWHEALGILIDLNVDRAELVRRHLANPGTACCDLCRPAPTGAATPTDAPGAWTTTPADAAGCRASAPADAGYRAASPVDAARPGTARG